ncbi:peroxisomal biogenesis factor 3 [Coccinella septempunctata]|uniref:peroxisomal biogenesis factor 3 n=1 Tax=Coccinella septempunctata TaxID=41139 RepID=UPI001D07D826|nr:peroxisomal biogenesis factor 3 [Coccinella septempunctata]
MMSVFSKVRNFVSRHRGKFIVSSILITSSIILTRYAQQKLKDWQEKEMLEFLERTRKQQHFENIGRTCNQTTMNLASSLVEALSHVTDTDKTIAELQANTGNKVIVWETLKIQLFTKLCCLIYAMSMLVIILRIQLSIIGGYLYKDPSSIPTEIQEKFLTLTQNLMNDGLNKISSKVTVVCKNILGQIDLKKPMRLSDIDALFWSLQAAIGDGEDNPIDNLKTYINLNFEEDKSSRNIYTLLLRDTLDLIESDEVKSLTTQCINRGFTQLADQLSEFFINNGPSSSKQNPEEVNLKKPLAKLLPIINGILSKNSFPDKFVQQLVSNERLHIFGANIYESLL